MYGCTMAASLRHHCCTTLWLYCSCIIHICSEPVQSCYSFPLQLQQQVWKETLEFASATLSPPTAASAAAAGTNSEAATTALGPAVAGLAAAQQPLGLRQKLKLLQQFLAWQREKAVLPALALPQLPVQVSSCFQFALCSCLSGHTGSPFNCLVRCCLTSLGKA